MTDHQENTIDPTDLGKSLLDTGYFLWYAGRYADALAAYDKALPLLLQDALPGDLVECRIYRDDCLDQLDRHEAALAAFEEALPLMHRHVLPADLAVNLRCWTMCLYALGCHEAALAAYDEILQLFRRHALLADLSHCFRDWANSLDALGRHEDALAKYDEAFTAEDRVTAAQQNLFYRTSSREQTTQYYQHAAKLALDLGQPERAWGYVQRSKGRTLVDLLGVRSELTALDREELLLIQQRDAGHVGDDAFATTISHIGDQRLARHAARFGHDPRTPMNLSDVLTALRSGEAILDAFTFKRDGTLAVFLLCPDQPSIRWVGFIYRRALRPMYLRWQEARASWSKAMDAIATIHREYPGTNPGIVGHRKRIIRERGLEDAKTKAAAAEAEVLADLGELIIAPILEYLDDTVTTLIVSPDGLLHQLPLAAITVPGPDSQPMPLVERLDLQFVPTATSLAILRGPHGPRVSWPPALLAAAPFATTLPIDEVLEVDPFTSDDRAVTTGTLRDVLREGEDPQHRNLPESGPEIDAVARLIAAVGGSVQLLPPLDATRSGLVDGLPTARILHLATHGSDLRKYESIIDYRILLADDTELRVRELYNEVVSLQDVFLVTLSACSLGQVMLQGAEASGFVQAFLQAGAGVVLAPIWAVYDLPTRLLMERFYTELTEDERPTVATAWRRACHWLRTQTKYTHPVFWAGFLPSGDASVRLTT